MSRENNASHIIRTGNRNEHDGFLVEFLKLEISAFADKGIEVLLKAAVFPLYAP
jgi:hypothetical protein